MTTGNIPNLIKTIYNYTANTVFMAKMECFSPKMRNKVKMSTLTSLFKHHIRDPIAVRRKQELKFTDWKGKRKCSLFACDMIL